MIDLVQQYEATIARLEAVIRGQSATIASQTAEIQRLQASVSLLSRRNAYYEFVEALDDEPRDREQLRALAATLVRDEGDL